jgi:hypothetical protein
MLVVCFAGSGFGTLVGTNSSFGFLLFVLAVIYVVHTNFISGKEPSHTISFCHKTVTANSSDDIAQRTISLIPT